MASRPEALILALNGLDHDRRVENEARSLAAAGFAVTRVGVRTKPDHPLHEVTEFDEILRIAPVWYPVAGESSSEKHPASDSPVKLVRQWRWKVRLMTALRRRLSRLFQQVDAFRTWLRWNSELVAACAHLRPDVVIATDFDTLLAGSTLKRRTGCALVYDAHELWVDMHNRMHLGRTFRWAFLLAERLLMRRADHAMTVCRSFADELARRHGVATPAVVYNGPETVVTRECRDVQPPLRVYYQGLPQQGRGLKELVDAARSLQGLVRVTIQGPGVKASEWADYAASLGLGDDAVEFLEPCPPHLVTATASQYDVGYAVNEPMCLNHALSVPNRLFTMMGACLALVVTAENPEMARIVSEHQCGIVIERLDAEAIAQALERLAADPVGLRTMERNSCAAARQFAWDVQFRPVLGWLASRGLIEPLDEPRTSEFASAS